MLACGSVLGGTWCNTDDYCLSRQPNVPLVVPITNRDQLRTLATSTWQPNFPSQCLLVPKKLLSCRSIQQLMGSHTPRHIYYPDHPVVKAMHLQRPSPVLVYFLTPINLPVAACSAIGERALNPDYDMVFTGHSNNQPIVTLFDSGASTSFISSNLCRRLELTVQPPLFKAVATATGEPSSISGRVTFTVRWGPIATQLNAHVLDALLPGVDLIAGRDFLNASHAVLDYGQGQCTLRSVAGCRTDLRASSQHGTSHPHWQVHPPAQSSPDRPCTAPERRCTAPAEQKLFGWLLPSAQTQILVPFRIGLSSRTENPYQPLKPCATCVSAAALTWSCYKPLTPPHQINL